jgi:hypothetical protein
LGHYFLTVGLASINGSAIFGEGRGQGERGIAVSKRFVDVNRAEEAVLTISFDAAENHTIFYYLSVLCRA